MYENLNCLKLKGDINSIVRLRFVCSLYDAFGDRLPRSQVDAVVPPLAVTYHFDFRLQLLQLRVDRVPDLARTGPYIYCL